MSLKILVCHNWYKKRGGEDVLVEKEVAKLRQEGNDVKVFKRSSSEIKSGRNVFLFWGSLWSFKSYQDLKKMLLEFKPDILHIHNTFPLLSPSVFWAAASTKTPLVQTIHNYRQFCLNGLFYRNHQVCEACLGKLPWRGVLYRCYRNSFFYSFSVFLLIAIHRLLGTWKKNTAIYIVGNVFTKTKLLSMGVPEEKIRVNFNLVDFEVREPTELDKTDFLFIGRFSPEKGIDLIMRAAAQLPQIKFQLAGGEKFEMPHNFPPPSNLKILGWLSQKELEDKLRNCLALIVPSYWYETGPRVVLEAFSQGCPVITSNFNSFTEFVKHKKNGLLFEAGNQKAFEEQLKWAYSNPGAMRRLGLAAYQDFNHHYKPHDQYLKLIQIYKETLQFSLNQ